MKYVFMWMACFTVFSAFSQTVTVLEGDKDEHLIGVSIASDSPTVAVFTNASGQADLSPFKGSAAITFSYLGYQSKKLSYAELEEQSWLVRLYSKNLMVEDVIVSANRQIGITKEVTQTVNVISQEETQLQSPQTAADLLAVSGQVLVQKSQQGGGSPMIRGFATNRVLIAVDGVRMNNAIFRSGNVQNVISIDPLSVTSTEVLFGPGSVMYGSDAIGGVMSFYTQNPSFSKTDEPLIKGSSLARFSSANSEFTAHLDVSLAKKRWAFYTSISQNQFGDLRMGSHGPKEYLRPEYVIRINGLDATIQNTNPLVQIPTSYNQINLLEKVAFKANKHLTLSYALHHSSTGNYDRYDRHIRYRNGAPRSAEWYYGPQKWTMNHFKMESNKSTAIFDQYTFSLAHQFFEESRYDRDFGDTELRERVEQVNAYSFNMDALKQIGKSTLYYGIESILNDVKSTGLNTLSDPTGNVSTQGPSRYPNALWQSHAVYATWKKKLSTKTILQLGARYNAFAIKAQFDTTFYPLPFTGANLAKGALSASVGIAFYPNEKNVIKFNLSNGYRAPNVDDIGKVFDSEPGAVVVPNPDLEPETAYNAELVYKRMIGKKMVLQTVAYYTYLGNAMVRANFQLNGQDSIVYANEMSRVQAIQNASYAYVFGTQLQLKYRFAKNFEFRSDFSWQQGEQVFQDGEVSALRHAGPWFGSSHIIFTHHPLLLDFYAVYNGEISYEALALEERSKNYLYAIDGNGNPYSPSWCTLNLKMKAQLNQTWLVSGGIENITDLRYKPYSSGIAAAGRNVILSINAIF